MGSEMCIRDSIRGDDHLSNLPVQVNLFNSFEADVPIFCHLPMIHGIDGKRLSKRHGAVDINHFLREGYRVDALINYLVKTGWSHGDKEIFSRKELLELFDLDRVTKSAATFDIDKYYNPSLKVISKEYLAEIMNILIHPYPKIMDIDVSGFVIIEQIEYPRDTVFRLFVS